MQLTVVDGEGRRHVLRGLAGQSVVDVLEGHLDTLGDDVVCLSPEGRGVREAHVKLPNELLAAFPAPAGDDARFLQDIADARSLDLQCVGDGGQGRGPRGAGRAAACCAAWSPPLTPPRRAARRRSSRLGSKVTLSKELDGTVIALGALHPWKSL